LSKIDYDDTPPVDDEGNIRFIDMAVEKLLIMILRNNKLTNRPLNRPLFLMEVVDSLFKDVKRPPMNA